MEALSRDCTLANVHPMKRGSVGDSCGRALSCGGGCCGICLLHVATDDDNDEDDDHSYERADDGTNAH